MNRNAEHKTMVIKKYENRRLYDTVNSRYVNLDEVAQAVRDGVDVQVVDATSGEDITRLVLTQIIVEDAKAPDSSFPLDVLRQMIVATGRASQEGALKYMKAVFDLYQSAYRSLPQQFTPFDFMQNFMAAGTPPPQSQEPPAKTAAPESAAASPSPGAPPEKDRENAVEDLRRRIGELENLISKMAMEQPKPKHKKPRR